MMDVGIIRIFIFCKIPFLTPRTSLFFVPLVALYLFSLVCNLYKNKQVAGKLVAILFIFLGTQHFAQGYNNQANYEWYFNQSTYQVLDKIVGIIEEEKIRKPVKIDCHWYFHPSLSYHINKKYNGVLKLLPYHKETQYESDAIFYYANPEDANEIDLLNGRFNRITDFKCNFGVLFIEKQSIVK